MEQLKEWNVPENELREIWSIDDEDVNREDWGHWGARAMLALNASIRMKARKRVVDENVALRNKRIIFHIAEEDLADMISDFAVHDLYGFGEIIFVENQPGAYLSADAETGTFRKVRMDQRVKVNGVEKELGNLVYGHGPATIALTKPGRATVLKRSQGQPIVVKLTDKSAAAYLQSVYLNVPAVIREHRLNDLRLLDPQQGDMEELALFNRLRASDPNSDRKPTYALFRMVRNPEQVVINNVDGKIKVVRKIQSGGLFFKQFVRGTESLAFLEGGATGGETKRYLENPATKSPDWATAYLNQMQTLKDLHNWVKAVGTEGLDYFYTVHKDPQTEKPVLIDGQVVLKPQMATGHMSLVPWLGARAIRGTPQNDKELYPGLLTDLKTPDPAQSARGLKFVDHQDEDPLIIALALKYGFPVNMAQTPVSVHEIRIEQQRISKDPDTAPLNARQTHGFSAAVAALVLIGLFINPLISIAAAPWALSAAAQESVVFQKAIFSGQKSVILSSDPIARYNFDEQKSYGVESVAAHAHELARAVTQSRSAWVPRLIAPLMIAIALLDRTVAALFDIVDWVSGRLTRGPPADEKILTELVKNQKAISNIFAEPDSTALAQASGIWLRILALYKNSEARQAAEELTAREYIRRAA